MNKIGFASACLLVLTHCAFAPAHELSPEGAQIPITEYIQPADRSHLREITQVTCELGQNAATQESNVSDCKNKLRNDAAKLGGILVLLEPEKQTIGKDVSDPLNGSMRCPNCVTLWGTVYGLKTITK